jgi:transcriptional regulator with XRE-family HTH domain
MKRKKSNSEEKKKAGTLVPGYTPELGSRIAIAIDRAGGLRNSAGAIGISEDSLAQWRDGKARPSFFGIRELSQLANVSIDWIATGEILHGAEESSDQTQAKPLDQDLLMMIIEELENFRSQHNLKWDNKQKSRLITLGYAMMLAEREKGNQVGPEMMRYLMQAAS